MKGASVGQRQWELNLAVLRDVPSQGLRRVQLCVIFGDDQVVCGDALEQIKRIRWRSLRDVLDRFADLVEIALVTRRVDEWTADCIWQEFEFAFRSLHMMRGISVIRNQLCIV